MSETRTGARQQQRDSLLLRARIKVIGGNTPRQALIRNLSAGGMMIDGYAELAVGDSVVAELPGLGRVRGKITWAEAGRAGMAFETSVDPSLARVRVEPAPRAPFQMLVEKSAARPGLRPVGSC